MTTRAFQKIYTKIDNITKATVTLRAEGVGNDELATVGGKLAQVVKIMGENVTLQVFAGTEGLATDSEVIFHGEPPKLRVSDNLAGRFFNAYGEPIEGGEAPEGEAREIGGPTVNPYRRIQPSELIATGIAGIDLNNTIVTGQKIPFFADPDQPYNAVMANVALRAKADKIILGGMGLTNDDFLYFKQVFENAGALDRIVSFVNTTENPPVERLLVPDMALTAAEYDYMVALWGEFDPDLLRVADVELTIQKIAGVRTPVLQDVLFEQKHYDLFSSPVWYADGVDILKRIARLGIEFEVFNRKTELLDYARRKTTQKVNLYEKVQIPGYEDAIRKIKRFMEDEENLSKSAQKIVKTKQQQAGEGAML